MKDIQKLPLALTLNSNQPSTGHGKARCSFVQNIKGLLSSMSVGVVPSILEVAELLNTSERSLRRALARESTSYAEIVDTWRCNEALQMINDRRCTLDELAWRLGYTNTPSFFRAFKRWTNQTPNRYRDLEAA